MSDLISRSAVIDIIHQEIERTSSWAEHNTQINIEFAVQELPCAYNVDKVVEELESEARFYNSASNSDQCVRYGIKKAIEIVKGGVE